MTKIIKATSEHLDATALLFDAYRVWYRLETDLEGSREFLQQRMEQNESEIFLAIDEDSGSAVGFTQLYPYFSSTRMSKLWLLNDLFVSKSHRGKGISLLLINAAKDLARKTGAIGLNLETEKSNIVGNALYPRAGFKRYEDENFYFWLAN